MRVRKYEKTKGISKRIVFSSAIGVIIVAVTVCGFLLVAKNNNDIAEGEKSELEQAGEIALDYNDGDVWEDIEYDEDESSVIIGDNEESNSKNNKVYSGNVSSDNTKKEESLNNEKTTTAVSCVGDGNSPVFMKPTSRECYITLKKRSTPLVYLNNLVGNGSGSGSISNMDILRGNNNNGKSIYVQHGVFSFTAMNPGKADIVIGEGAYNGGPIFTMHVTVEASETSSVVEAPETPAVVELKEINVTCPSREIVMEYAKTNPNTWIDGGSISYEPSNATLTSDSTISIQPNDYIDIQFGSYGGAAYSVRPQTGLQAMSGSIKVTVKNGSISGSCTF